MPESIESGALLCWFLPPEMGRAGGRARAAGGAACIMKIVLNVVRIANNIATTTPTITLGRERLAPWVDHDSMGAVIPIPSTFSSLSGELNRN